MAHVRAGMNLQAAPALPHLWNDKQKEKKQPDSPRCDGFYQSWLSPKSQNDSFQHYGNCSNCVVCLISIWHRSNPSLMKKKKKKKSSVFDLGKKTQHLAAFNLSNLPIFFMVQHGGERKSVTPTIVYPYPAGK